MHEPGLDVATVKDAVRRHWATRAATFDDAPNHGLHTPAQKEAWQVRLRSWAGPSPVEVLDIGCGAGRVTLALAPCGYAVDGLDLTAAMVEAAHALAAQKALRADFVQAVCAKAGSAGLKAFGAYSTSAAQLAIANSLGVYHHHRSTQATVNSVVMGEAGSGYADRSAIDVADMDREELAEEVIDKAARNQHAQPIEPGVYEVVLEEYAVAEMLEFLSFMGFSALAAQEERSFMRLGERITGEPVAIWDDGLDRSGLPAPFDFEGVPKQRVDLIKNGVATGLVYDQLTAARAGRPSTGHGLPAPNAEGPFAVNLFMAPGSVAKAELASGIKRGIWITRFWYVRMVQPKASVITGMTREGTFLIENGKLTRPVKDLRFTESILRALQGTEALSQTTKLQASEYFGASRVPAVHLKAFTFTS